MTSLYLNYHSIVCGRCSLPASLFGCPLIMVLPLLIIFSRLVPCFLAFDPLLSVSYSYYGFRSDVMFGAHIRIIDVLRQYNNCSSSWLVSYDSKNYYQTCKIPQEKIYSKMNGLKNITHLNLIGSITSLRGF